MAGFSKTFLLFIGLYVEVLQPPDALHRDLGSSHFARRYFGNLIRFLFLQLLRCFNSLGLPPFGYSDITRNGLPHSEIPGSMRASRSPRRFAGSCVLLRLSVPRHPPYALCILPIFFGLSYFRLSPVLHDSVILLHTCFFLRIKISSR